MEKLHNDEQMLGDSHALELLNKLVIEEVNADGDGVNSFIVKDTPEHACLLKELGATDEIFANMRQGFEKEGLMDIAEIAIRFADIYECGVFGYKGLDDFNDWAMRRERELLELERFEEIGKGDDFTFQTIVHMQLATQKVSLASTLLGTQKTNVPEELKEKIKNISQNLHEVIQLLQQVKK